MNVKKSLQQRGKMKTTKNKAGHFLLGTLLDAITFVRNNRILKKCFVKLLSEIMCSMLLSFHDTDSQNTKVYDVIVKAFEARLLHCCRK